MHINHGPNDVMSLRNAIQRFVVIAKDAIERADFTLEDLKREMQRIHDEGFGLLQGKKDKPATLVGSGGFDTSHIKMIQPRKRGK